MDIFSILEVIAGVTMLIYAAKKGMLFYKKTKHFPIVMFLIAMIGFCFALTGGILIMKPLITVVPSEKSFEGTTSPSTNSTGNNTRLATERSETCEVCGNTFTGNGYEKCYDGSWRECRDPYISWICGPTCGQKSVEKLERLSRQIQNDGKIYDKDPCSLCNGTGIEKNKSSLSNEYGRICPMCNGKGRQSY